MRNCLLIVAMSVFCTGAACAQDDATHSPDHPTITIQEHREANVAIEPSVPVLEESTPDPARTAERRKKALAGLAALCGIAITGVAAIAATIVWARRLRRLARDPGPAQTTAGNDFWFLKPPKQVVAKDSPDERQPPLGSSSETDRSQ
ncbi:hypothetical protein [Schlesneria paludicola]|uniref:hypothetical protein n=1 Tax=Schlesneria paludicola TaxID=360056 RepID=UPI0012F92621|nr:hypothetical protein [Schlesneria paludicola]